MNYQQSPADLCWFEPTVYQCWLLSYVICTISKLFFLKFVFVFLQIQPVFSTICCLLWFIITCRIFWKSNSCNVQASILGCEGEGHILILKPRSGSRMCSQWTYRPARTRWWLSDNMSWIHHSPHINMCLHSLNKE